MAARELEDKLVQSFESSSDSRIADFNKQFQVPTSTSSHNKSARVIASPRSLLFILYEKLAQVDSSLDK